MSSYILSCVVTATAAARGSTPLREMTLKQCQVNLPRSSSALVISSPPDGSDQGVTVTSPKRKNASSTSSSSTIKTIEHNIPHKLVIYLVASTRVDDVRILYLYITTVHV